MYVFRYRQFRKTRLRHPRITPLVSTIPGIPQDTLPSVAIPSNRFNPACGRTGGMLDRHGISYAAIHVSASSCSVDSLCGNTAGQTSSVSGFSYRASDQDNPWSRFSSNHIACSVRISCTACTFATGFMQPVRLVPLSSVAAPGSRQTGPVHRNHSPPHRVHPKTSRDRFPAR